MGNLDVIHLQSCENASVMCSLVFKDVIPNYSNALNTCNSSLQTVVDFPLADQAYARATMSEVESVGIWLGAGVMVEYPLDEARELLVS